MEPISDAVKKSVNALIAKAEQVNLVQSVKQIIAELSAAGLAYQMKLLPRLVGCHPQNRDGFGVSGSAAHELTSSIFSLGFAMAKQNACVSKSGQRTVPSMISTSR